MGKDVYAYLKYDGQNLTFSNELEGSYEEVTPTTVTASANSGDRVIWQCEGGIDSIGAIDRDPESPKIFTDEGVQPVNPKCWAGTVKTLEEQTREKYTITFTDTNGRTHTIDPGTDGNP